MQRFSFVFLIVLIVLMPLPWGAIHSWSMMLLSCGLFLLGLMVVWQGKAAVVSSDRHSSYSYLWACWLLWLGYIVLQLVPVPASWMELVSPAAWQLRCDVLSEQVCQGAHPISLHPEETFRDLLFSTALMVLFFSVITLVQQRRQVIVLMYVLLLAGMFQAAYGVFMALSGLDYGFFERKTYNLGRATGTFTNPNHLAGYLEMCVCVGVGLLLYQFKKRERRGNWRESFIHFFQSLLSAKVMVRLGLVVIVIGLIMTRSRMGNSAFFGSVVIGGFAWLLFTQRATKVTMILLTSLILVDIFLIGGWFGFEKVAERIGSTDLKAEMRVPATLFTWDMVEDYFVLGSGLGSFVSVFAGYKQAYTGALFAHAHNDYLEFLAEVGILGCIPLASIWLYGFYCSIYAMRKRRSSLHQSLGLGCFMAMTSIAIHSFVDFNLQIPANAATFVLILALSWVAAHGRLDEVKRKRVRVES